MFSQAEASGEQIKDGIRCYMTKEGALVCEKLEPGNYRWETIHKALPHALRPFRSTSDPLTSFTRKHSPVAQT